MLPCRLGRVTVDPIPDYLMLEEPVVAVFSADKPAVRLVLEFAFGDGENIFQIEIGVFNRNRHEK